MNTQVAIATYIGISFLCLFINMFYLKKKNMWGERDRVGDFQLSGYGVVAIIVSVFWPTFMLIAPGIIIDEVTTKLTK